jgi:hypothetical protein
MLFIPLENNKKKNLHEKMKNHAKEALILFFLISGAPMQGRIGDSVIGKRWSQNDFFEL